jgi:hypothetical protein
MSQKLTGQKLLLGPHDRGGLRANILRDGMIKTGDVIKPV